MFEVIPKPFPDGDDYNNDCNHPNQETEYKTYWV